MSSYAEIGLSDEDMANLRNDVYKGYTRIPMTRRAKVKSQGWVERPQEGGGTIDFGAYGGKNKYGYQHNSINPFSSDKTKLNNAANWKRIADHLGIKKINSENDLRQMHDFVTGYAGRAAAAAAKPEPEPEPTPPPVFTPSEELTDAQEEFEQTRLDKDENSPPLMSYTSDVYADINNQANNQLDWYNKKFLPSIKAEANLGAREIGESASFHLGNFIGAVPKLGDPKELAEYYMGKLA